MGKRDVVGGGIGIARIEVCAEGDGVDVALPHEVACERAGIANVNDGAVTDFLLYGHAEIHDGGHVARLIDAEDVLRGEQAGGGEQRG